MVKSSHKLIMYVSGKDLYNIYIRNIFQMALNVNRNVENGSLVITNDCVCFLAPILKLGQIVFFPIALVHSAVFLVAILKLGQIVFFPIALVHSAVSLTAPSYTVAENFG